MHSIASYIDHFPSTNAKFQNRAAAGQMGDLSRIVLLCHLPTNIMEVKKTKTKKQQHLI